MTSYTTTVTPVLAWLDGHVTTGETVLRAFVDALTMGYLGNDPEEVPNFYVNHRGTLVPAQLRQVSSSDWQDEFQDQTWGLFVNVEDNTLPQSVPVVTVGVRVDGRA